MDQTDVGPERRALAGAALVLFAVAALAAIDLAGDLREGTTVRHAVVEGAIVLTGAGGLAALLARLRRLDRAERAARAAAAGLAADLDRTRAEAERWREEARVHLAGLGSLIDGQLERWGLTPAEKETALLLLKGLSHKEVASLRGVGVATARQQAASVYAKAGVGGRHDLAAFFLEDLLAPRGPADAGG